MGKMSRTKGHSFERAVAAALRVVFPGARRQLEYHENDCLGIDIAETGLFKIQCKAWAKYAPIACIFEIRCDRQLGDIPVLITKGNKLEPMAVLPLDDFIRLISQ